MIASDELFGDELFGSERTAIVQRSGESQVAVLALLGRAVPVGAFAASAVVAWYADSTFWLVLTSLAAAFFSLMLGLHVVLWRLECRRANTHDQQEGVSKAG